MAYIDQDASSSTYTNHYVNLKNYILLNLGHPLVRVELTEEMIRTAIIDALTMYHRYATVDYSFIHQSVSSNPFPVPTGLNKEVIVDILFPSSFFDSLGSGIAAGGFIGEFEGTVIPVFNQQGILNIFSQFNLPLYYTYLQRLEDIKKIVGIDKMWEILDDKIYLFPINQPVHDVGILYKGRLTESEAEEQIWIKKYALARAKMILGTIRSKFSGINASGANLAADGEALKTESATEIEKLEVELKGMQRPLPLLQN
jgi:hypothetical protein